MAESVKLTKPQETTRVRPVRILVVDDDINMCQLTEAALQRNGYEATVCTDSAKVMDLLKDGLYGCVLLDIRMKGLEGTELLPIIKRSFPALPVILVSAYCDRSNASYYTALGAFEIVTKPYPDDLLLDVISRAVGGKDMIPLMLTNLSLDEAREQVFRKLIVMALQRSHWNQVKAAQLLGISRYSLRRWLRRLQITY